MRRMFQRKPCRILANRKGTLAHMWALFKGVGEGICVRSFECRRCHLKWKPDALGSHTKVSCSECYSDNIVITSVRVEHYVDNAGVAAP